MPQDSTRIRLTESNKKKLLDWSKKFPEPLSLAKLANMVLRDGRFPVYANMRGQHLWKK